ncbi:MAG TPA: hypothetical protein VKD08_05590 [Ignavibacteriaceae bacterium]|nr:hypothetical protein [Ignavibacteriaceae bacterium]
MIRFNIVIFCLVMAFLTGSAFAGNHTQKELKDYFNKINREVQQTENPAQKREVLNNSFDDLLKAFNTAQQMPLSEKDMAGINYFKQKVQDRKNELNGLNGYDKVEDASLNQFANYSTQQFEQSAEYITISVIALVLIIILVALLL